MFSNHSFLTVGGQRRLKQYSQPTYQTDIYRTLHPATGVYTFFLREYGTFTKTDQTLGHKTRLNTFNRIQSVH